MSELDRVWACPRCGLEIKDYIWRVRWSYYCCKEHAMMAPTYTETAYWVES